jgi:integrase
MNVYAYRFCSNCTKGEITVRNENGFGSIVCLDKSGKKRRKPWAVRITTGWNDGRQVRKYLGYYRTQADALVALAEYHKEGIGLDLTKMTLGEVYDQWIKRKEQTITAGAIKTHKMAYARFGALKDTPIRDIKKLHLQKWLDDIDLKPGSKARLRSTMHQIFEHAVAYDIIPKNYAKDLEIAEKVEKTGAIFTEDELKTLWDNKADQLVQYLLILTYTGMRIGELLAMTKDTIYLDKGYMVGGSKTEAGKDRIIPIHNKIKHLVEQNMTYNHLATSGRGEAYSYSGIVKTFRKLMKKLKMNHKIHDTRKTAVSIMHRSGIPMETIRMIVGHSGKGVTETVYLYKEPKELVEIINTIEIPYYCE